MGDVTEDSKRCSQCGVVKPHSSYYKRARARDGLQSECKECRNRAVKTWKSDNPDAARRHEGSRNRDVAKEREAVRARRATPAGKAQTLKYLLKSQHGITVEEYEEMLAKQGGLCAICHRPPRGGNHADARLHVDHCHQSGVIRGLLCRHCNTAIGLLEDDPQRMHDAAAYIANGGLLLA